MHAEQDILAGIDQMRHKIEHPETKVDGYALSLST